MIKKHCDGCNEVLNLDQGYSIVSVSFFKSNDQEFGSNEQRERPRDICVRCMSKVRPGLNEVDGK